MKKTWVVGVDEAGRGPLAGPVAVGVVCVRQGFRVRSIPGLNDSKQLTEYQREEAFARLLASPDVSYAVAMVSARVIDRDGIQHAIRRALARALAKLNVPPDDTLVLLDGALRAPDAYTHQKTIIRGDETEPVISAASIVAKVTRDRYMCNQHRQFPVYGFNAHKGYGTRVHRTAIMSHGLCPLHRRTFCRNIRSI